MVVGQLASFLSLTADLFFLGRVVCLRMHVAAVCPVQVFELAGKRSSTAPGMDG